MPVSNSCCSPLAIWCGMLLLLPARSLQSCLTLCDPKAFSLPGSFVHGILQARILEWDAMPSSRGSSQPRDRTRVSRIAGRFSATKPPGKRGIDDLICKTEIETQRERTNLSFLSLTLFFPMPVTIPIQVFRSLLLLPPSPTANEPLSLVECIGF